MNASFSVKRSYSRKYAPVVEHYEAMSHEAPPPQSKEDVVPPVQQSHQEYYDYEYDYLYDYEEGAEQ